MAADDFSLSALYSALDAQRTARGLTWAAAMREISATSTPRPRAISSSTVRGLQTKRVAEGDGVLQMLRWLGRTPESFAPGHVSQDATRERLPEAAVDQVLSFDTVKIYDALDAQRRERGLTWQQVVREMGRITISVSTLTHLKAGGRTGFLEVLHITRWLGQPAAAFVRISPF